MADAFSFRAPLTSAPAPAGPLAGTRVVLQPNLSVRGWPTEAGSLALESYVALEDATVVARLRDAGAVLVGSSRMAELGFGLVEGAAEALGECDVALVADTMGEARHVASAAGACGLKPSYGIVSRFGLIGLVPSMECVGVVAASPATIARVMAVVAGPDERDPSMRAEPAPDFAHLGSDDGVATAGVVRELAEALEPDERDAFDAALGTVAATGARIREVSLPDFDLFRTVHHVVGSTEASSSAGKYDGVRYGHRAADAANWNEMYLRTRAECFGTLVKAYLFQGACFQFERYAAFVDAARLRRRLLGQTDALFAEADVLVAPVARPAREGAAAADTVEAVYDALALTLPANVTGHPTLAVPGAGCGLQLVGPHLADARLLSFAARLLRSEP